MQDLVSQYLGWVEVNRSADHADRSRRAIRNVFGRMSKVRTAEDITPSRIEDFKRRRLRGVFPNTVNLELRHFKAFLSRCVKQGWLQEMPVEIEQVKAPERRRVVLLSDAEINPFLDSLRLWARESSRFFILTGLRLDEGRFLEWEDVDLDTGQIWVKNKPELGFSPKNGKERVVPLPPELTGNLRVVKRQSGWVLRGERSGQVDRRAFQTAVAKAGEVAGLAKRVTPHVLRHTYGSRLAMAGGATSNDSKPYGALRHLHDDGLRSPVGRTQEASGRETGHPEARGTGKQSCSAPGMIAFPVSGSREAKIRCVRVDNLVVLS